MTTMTAGLNRTRAFSFFCLIASFVFLLNVGARAEEGQTSLEVRILERIRVKHVALNCGDWQAFGAEAPRTIASMLEAPERESDRIKLIEGLGCFSDAQSKQVLKSLATQAVIPLHRRVAIESITRAGSDAETDAWVRGFLDHADPQTRFSAAQSLIQSGSEEARSWVRDAIAQEKESWIRKKLEARLEKGIVRPGGGGTGDADQGDRSILRPKLKTQKAPSLLEESSKSNIDPASWSEMKKTWSGEWRGSLIRLRSKQEREGQKSSSKPDDIWESRSGYLRLSFGAEVGSLPQVEISLQGGASVKMGRVLLRGQEIAIMRASPQAGTGNGISGDDLGSWVGTLERDSSEVQVLLLKPAPGIRKSGSVQPSRMVLFRTSH